MECQVWPSRSHHTPTQGHRQKKPQSLNRAFHRRRPVADVDWINRGREAARRSRSGRHLVACHLQRPQRRGSASRGSCDTTNSRNTAALPTGCKRPLPLVATTKGCGIDVGQCGTLRGRAGECRVPSCKLSCSMPRRNTSVGVTWSRRQDSKRSGGCRRHAERHVGDFLLCRHFQRLLKPDYDIS